MKYSRCLTTACLFLVAFIGANHASAQSATGIYWMTSQSILYASFEDLESVIIVTREPRIAMNKLEGIVLDEPNGKLYWFDSWTDQLMRANLDGSEVEIIIDFNLIEENEGKSTFPYFSLDSRAGKVYWSVPNRGVIQRANLDGSDIETVITSDVRIFAPEVHHDARKLYWLEYFLSTEPLNTFRVADLGIWEPNDLFSPDGENLITSFFVDPSSEKISWLDRFTPFIYQADLGGSELDRTLSASASQPEYVAMDAFDGTRYWSDSGTNAIWRELPNSSDKQKLVDVINPSGFALGYMDAPLATNIEKERAHLVDWPALSNVSSYPNPFRASTSISFDLDQDRHIRIGIYNLLGQEIVRLADTFFPAGSHALDWDGQFGEGKDVPAGVYITRIEADSKASKVLTLVKH